MWNVTNPPRATEKSMQNIQVITIKKSSLPSVSTSSDDCHTPQSMPHATVNATRHNQSRRQRNSFDFTKTERQGGIERGRDRQTGKQRDPDSQSREHTELFSLLIHRDSMQCAACRSEKKGVIRYIGQTTDTERAERRVAGREREVENGARSGGKKTHGRYRVVK